MLKILLQKEEIFQDFFSFSSSSFSFWQDLLHQFFSLFSSFWLPSFHFIWKQLAVSFQLIFSFDQEFCFVIVFRLQNVL